MPVRSAALALLWAPSHATLGVVGEQRRWHRLEERHSSATSSDRSSAGCHSASQQRRVGDQNVSFRHRFGAAEGSFSGAVPRGIQTPFRRDLRGCWHPLQALSQVQSHAAFRRRPGVVWWHFVADVVWRWFRRRYWCRYGLDVRWVPFTASDITKFLKIMP